MYDLYNRKFWWVANYKEKIGEDFWRITEEFIDSLTQYKSDSYWYMQERLNFF